MRNYSFLLLPVLLGTAVLTTGCDSSCCGSVETQPQPQNKQAPTAVIDLAGNVTNNGECTPGDAITLIPKSTDTDGTVEQNIWEIDNQVVANTQIVCPDAGVTQTICLTAVDNDGLESTKVCKIIKGKTAILTTTPPVSIIGKGTKYDDGQELNCNNVHDTDTIDTDGVPNIYGTDHAIKKIIWDYTYYKAGDVIESGPFTKTQTQYNQDEGKPEGYCTKWFHTYGGVEKIALSLTTVDDDDETNTTKYIFNVANGTLTAE